MISLAILGLVGMQAYYISESYQLKSQLFDQSVRTALNTVAARVEKADAARFLKERISPPELPEFPSFDTERLFAAGKGKDTSAGELSAGEHKSMPSIITLQQYTKDVLILSERTPSGTFRPVIRSTLFGFERDFSVDDFEQYLRNTEFREWGIRDGRTYVNKEHGIDINDLKKTVREHQQEVEKQLGRDPGKPASDHIQFLLPLGNRYVPADLDGLRKLYAQHSQSARRNQDMERELRSFFDSLKTIQQKFKVFEELAADMQKTRLPLAERVNPADVQSLLKKELTKQGVSLPYHFEVRQADDSPLFASHRPDFGEQAPDTYEVSLFANDVTGKHAGTLIVNIPNKDRYLLRNMTVLIGASGVLILIILASFAVTVYSILRQKKLSQMKNDFINNMTHEFKTPVSTIMLASEALKDDQLSGDQKLVSRYAGIIYDENLRLGNYVERVLNMARLERSDFKVDYNPIRVNELIQAVTDSMALQLNKGNASLHMHLEAGNDRILGDELHFSNIIVNLVENAIKYSEGDPDITVRTWNEGEGLKLSVADKGIGMSKEQRKKIFEKFYRAQTGNLHDVKGFGLGLNYVNSIVKLLNGTIKVRSELGKGSEFEMSFPVILS